MKIKTLTAIIHNGEEYPTGSLLDLEDIFADRLVRLKSAVPALLPEVPEEVEEDVIEDKPPSFGAVTPGVFNEEVVRQESLKDLCRIDGVDVEIASHLYDAGYASVVEVSLASLDDLKGIKPLKKKNLRKILESAEELTQNS